MFYIVETEEQLEKLKLYGGLGCYLEIITSNSNYHSALSDLTAVYLRPVSQEGCKSCKGYIIPINHDEGISVSRDKVLEVIKEYRRVCVLDKKALLYKFPELSGNNVWDLQILSSMVDCSDINLAFSNGTVNWFYNRYGEMENLSRIIPLSKIYEICERTYEHIEYLLHYKEPSGYQFYNTDAVRAYFLVEQGGLRVDVHEFIEKFNPRNPDFSIKGEIVHNSYNLHNVTSRPTNSFNAVNFLAIPKGIEHRRVFKPQNDTFVEMDFDGYHVRLISKEIGYNLDPIESAHKQLAKLYFGKEEISNEEYQKAKGINFQMIYGSIPEEYQNLEFSKKIREFTGNLWGRFNKEGKIINNISGKEFTKNLKEMHAQKLMNYLIQSLETARNVKILKSVLKYLRDKKTKVCLITYDSFLIDWDESEGEEVLQEIQKRMEEGGFPVKIKKSKDLNFS